MTAQPDPTRPVGRLRQAMIEAASRPGFRHHTWYVRYHLEIVEQIALELAAHYPEADPDLVMVLVWLHDYGKTLTVDNDHEMTLTAGRAKLAELGFADDFTQRVLTCVDLIDRKVGLDRPSTPIEARIVSSADGCSHLVGPFFYLWWWEHADRPFEQLMADNRRKLEQDWQRKVVLPQARAAFAARHALLMEQTGRFPDRYIDPVA